MMHGETLEKQHTDVALQEARIDRDAGCTPAGNEGAQTNGNGVAVWDHVINALLAGYRNEGVGRTCLKRPARPARQVTAYLPSRHIQVEVLERVSETSVTVLWRDATRGRYDDQVWISCRARTKGRCALSGAEIRPNDPIYKPRVRSAVPANAAAMILASVIARMPSRAMEGDLR